MSGMQQGNGATRQRLFYALAEPTRRNIIELLANNGQLSATDISDNFSVSAPAISQHLKVLREANFVRVEKRAQQRIYNINPAAISEIEGWVQKIIEHWNARFDALDKVLELEKEKIKKRGMKR